MMNAHELKAALRQFTGTEEWYYHPLFKKYRYTEGVRFIAGEAGAYWLLEKILSNQILPELKGEGFQLWKLKVEDNKTALLTCDNGNGDIVYQETIDYTDFSLDKISFYFTDSVLLLPSEY
ncbi:MAG: DUF6876 family protein [Patescibacteria group bacterium]